MSDAIDLTRIERQWMLAKAALNEGSPVNTWVGRSACDVPALLIAIRAAEAEGDELARLLDESLEREKALEERADVERERAERLKAALLHDHVRHRNGCECLSCAALADDDRRRAAQGEGT